MTVALRHDFKPLGSAKAVFECRDSEVLLSGPAGTGKSRACLEKMNLLALLNPGMRGLIVRKTLASLGSTALVTWREYVIKEALETGLVHFYGGSSQEAAQYKYSNGSTITVGGLDRATRIMSSEYDAIYVQEAIELAENDWESLTTRLRNGRISFQQLLADTNPDVPHHWLKQRCDKGVTTLLDSRHEDNPVLCDAAGQLTRIGRDYIGKLDNLTGVRHARLRRGLWIAAEGLIYEDYNPAVHLIDKFEIPENWPRYWAVDFGFTNPFVCQFWAEDPDGRLYLYREIYKTKRTVDQHAADIKSILAKNPEPFPRSVICDHDAEGRAVFARELGIGTRPAKKTVADGIDAVQTRLRRAGDGKPRLFLMRDICVSHDPELIDAKKPTCTSEEMVGYVWDTSAAKAIKEMPLKEYDHGMDAMRYMVAERDLAARPRVRFM